MVINLQAVWTRATYNPAIEIYPNLLAKAESEPRLHSHQSGERQGAIRYLGRAFELRARAASDTKPGPVASQSADPPLERSGAASNPP